MRSTATNASPPFGGDCSGHVCSALLDDADDREELDEGEVVADEADPVDPDDVDDGCEEDDPGPPPALCAMDDDSAAAITMRPAAATPNRIEYRPTLVLVRISPRRSTDDRATCPFRVISRCGDGPPHEGDSYR